MHLNTIGLITIITYLVGALAQGGHLLEKFSLRQSFFLILSCLALSTHGWILYKLIDTPQGQNLAWPLMLSFMLWLMNLLIILSSTQSKSENLSVLTYPITAIVLGLALVASGTEVYATKAHPGMLTHILISLTSMSLLTLASFQAILMGVQNALLKHHRPSPMLRILPPLQTMEHLLFIIIWCGFGLLTGTLVSGFLSEIPLTLLVLPKMLLAFSAWVGLVLLLVGRYCFGWRGPTAIRWTISITFLALISYYGTKAFIH